MFYRYCTIHNLPIGSPDPADSMESTESLVCPSLKPHAAKYWFIKGDDGLIYGLAGRACGGYTAFEPENWVAIPGEIEEAIGELCEDALKSTADWVKVDAIKRVEALWHLLEMVKGMEEYKSSRELLSGSL